VKIISVSKKDAFDDEDRWCGLDTLYEKITYALMTPKEIDVFQEDHPPEDFPYSYVTLEEIYNIPFKDYSLFKQFAFGMSIDPRDGAEVYCA
jgi:hypothetical protein